MRTRHSEGYGCNEMEEQTRYFQCGLDFQRARTRTIVRYISDFKNKRTWCEVFDGLCNDGEE